MFSTKSKITTRGFLIASLVVPALLVACGDDAEQEPLEGPGAFAADYETSTAFFTNMAEPVLGASPHALQQTWYSSNLKAMIDQAAFTAPEGSVSIKKFDPDNEGVFKRIAVMVKREAGYDPENGDWYYEMRDIDGNVLDMPAAGKIASCIGCHAAASATDYLAGTQLK